MDEELYLTLIYKELAGEISQEESAQLHTWLQSSESNRQLYQEVQETWEISTQLGASPQVDLDTEFAALDALLEEENEPVAAAPRSSGKTWMAIAASLLILAVAGFFLLSRLSGKQDLQLLQAEKDAITHTFADGSVVHLKKGSQLRYPESFDAELRETQLDGEAFFKVQADQKRPFVVKTSSGQVRVLGTEFYVQSLPEQPGMAVSVTQGRVAVAGNEKTGELVLRAGQSGRLDTQSGEIRLDSQGDPNRWSWHTGILVFKDTPVSQVIQNLANSSGAQVEIEQADILNCPFTARFEKAGAWEVLQSLSRVLNAELVDLGEDHYRLKGGACD